MSPQLGAPGGDLSRGTRTGPPEDLWLRPRSASPGDTRGQRPSWLGEEGRQLGGSGGRSAAGRQAGAEARSALLFWTPPPAQGRGCPGREAGRSHLPARSPTLIRDVAPRPLIPTLAPPGPLSPERGPGSPWSLSPGRRAAAARLCCS